MADDAAAGESHISLVAPEDSVSNVGSQHSRVSVAAEKRIRLLEIRRKQLDVEMRQLQLEAAFIEEAALEDGQNVPIVERSALNVSEFPALANGQNVPIVDGPAYNGSEFRELLATLRLPQTQLPKFEGDPLKYWTFIRAFDHSVGDMPVDAAAKLNRLLQYYVGKALKVIEGCAVMEPSIGYAKARQLLKERFGNDYTISDAWVRRIVEGFRQGWTS